MGGHGILLLLLLALAGCAHGPCAFQHPLDGKAIGSCQRGKIAKEYCERGPGEVESFDYWEVRCK